jgi:hypothetical protein
MRLPQNNPRDFAVRVGGALTATDITRLRQSTLPANPPTIRKLNARHYNTARLISDGLSDQEIAFQTGRSVGHIGVMRSDPMMQGLVEFFLKQRVDVEIAESKRFRARLLNIGDEILQSVEEQVELDPSVMSFAERRAWVQLVADRTVAPPKQSGPAIVAPQQITFQIAGSKIINQAPPEPKLTLLEGEATTVVTEDC